MGLLTRDGEKEIAMRIEEAKEEVREVLLSYPGTIKELLDLYSSLKMSELSLSEIAPRRKRPRRWAKRTHKRKRSSTCWRR